MKPHSLIDRAVSGVDVNIRTCHENNVLIINIKMKEMQSEEQILFI